MTLLRHKTAIVAALLASFAAADTVLADLSDDLRYGLQLYGVRFNRGYDPLSKGYQLNVSFTDPNTGLPFYNDTHFYLGVGDLVMESGSLNAGLNLSERGVPAARFALSTGNRPLDYRYDSFLMAQDVVIDGSILLDVNTYINQWGFYDVTLQASNRATVTAKDQEIADLFPELDFDIGPINLSGNIYVDALAVVTDPFFERFGMENPFARFNNGLAGVNLRSGGIEDLIARLQSGQLLSDTELAQVINNSVVATALGQEPSSNLFAKMIIPEGLFDTNLQTATVPETDRTLTMAIPEPGMLALLAAAGAGYFIFPRRRAAK
jgi:hypothetical protein